MSEPRGTGHEALARVRAVLLDVDGVLTDGGLYYFDGGGFAVRFDARDGLGIVRARRAGILVGIVSGRPTPQAKRRAEELGIEEIHLEVQDKAAVVDDILYRHGIAPADAAFVGDDGVDLAAMRRVGVPVAVADAEPDVKREATYVTARAGGRGAVREVLELVLAGREPNEGDAP